MKIIIGSDLAPTRNNCSLFKSGKLLTKIDKNFQNKWFDSDYRVFNLEIVLGDECMLKPIKKAGPNLLAKKECINGIRELKPNLVLLANNHIFDYGIEGLDSTINILSDNNIKYTGIIDNINATYHPYIFEKDGLRVGIFNVCENEFSSATLNNKGTNSLIESKCYYEILSCKKELDRLIVIFHGGKEFYQYVSPNLRRICRGFIDFGADCVIVQHTHCIGCREKYKGKEILYGQGNFIFNNDEYVSDKELLASSLLVEINITNTKISVDYIPLQRDKELISISQNSQIINSFEMRSNQILDEKFLLNEYERFIEKNLITYLKIFDRQNLVRRFLYKFLDKKIYLKTYKDKYCLGILNSIECEAHREIVINGFKKIIGDYDNDKEYKN